MLVCTFLVIIWKKMHFAIYNLNRNYSSVLRILQIWRPLWTSMLTSQKCIIIGTGNSWDMLF